MQNQQPKPFIISEIHSGAKAFYKPIQWIWDYDISNQRANTACLASYPKFFLALDMAEQGSKKYAEQLRILILINVKLEINKVKKFLNENFKKNDSKDLLKFYDYRTNDLTEFENLSIDVVETSTPNSWTLRLNNVKALRQASMSYQLRQISKKQKAHNVSSKPSIVDLKYTDGITGLLNTHFDEPIGYYTIPLELLKTEELRQFLDGIKSTLLIDKPLPFIDSHSLSTAIFCLSSKSNQLVITSPKQKELIEKHIKAFSNRQKTSSQKSNVQFIPSFDDVEEFSKDFHSQKTSFQDPSRFFSSPQKIDLTEFLEFFPETAESEIGNLINGVRDEVTQMSLYNQFFEITNTKSLTISDISIYQSFSNYINNKINNKKRDELLDSAVETFTK